jgi:Putative metallopeptidase
MRRLHPRAWNTITNSILSIATVAVSVIAAPVAQARSVDGQIRVEYEAAKTPLYQAVSGALQRDQGFEAEAEGLSQALALPRDITVSFQECGINVTSYTASASLIVMCYELVERFRQDFVSLKTIVPENAPNYAINAGKFVFLHEIGHALIHDWNLPVLGREEDAADQFATVLLSFGGGDRSRLAWAAAVQLLIASEQQPDDRSLVWDQHSSALRRFQSIACLSYGSNPAEYSDLPETLVPASQRDQCVADFQQTAQSWGQLLRPHLRR